MFTRISVRTLPVLATVMCKEDYEEPEKSPATYQKTSSSYYNLSVRIIRGRNISGKDLLSKPDCYISLSLPTATAKGDKTKVINNSCNPVWNEAFHYRIQSQIKNVLDLSMYDNDVLHDDLFSQISIDVNQIKAGEKFQHTFHVGKKKDEVLEVELVMEKSPDPPTEVITNGVLVACPILCTEVTVNRERKNFLHGDESLVLKVNGAFEEEQKNTYKAGLGLLGGRESFIFHRTKDIDTQLEVERMCLTTNPHTALNDQERNVLTLPLNSLSSEKETVLNRKVPLGKGRNVDIEVQNKVCSKDLDVRLNFDLSEDEKNFLEKRLAQVACAMTKSLGLNGSLDHEEVPVVAVVGSGGGTRAMTSLYGSLLGLQKLDLLDCITYINGVSGSTWCMSTLYEDADWSHKQLQDPVFSAQNCVSRKKAGAFSPEHLYYYYNEKTSKKLQRQKMTIADLWGLIIEYMLYGKKNPEKLSNQKEAVLHGQNPYPIYTAVNIRDHMDGQNFAEWCEFTPHEIGFPKYGAFIRTENFNSEFFMGRMIRKCPEPRICYLLGLWSSIFSMNLIEAWTVTTKSSNKWLNWLKKAKENSDDDHLPYIMDNTESKYQLISPPGVTSYFKDFFTDRPAIGEYYNFLHGLQIHRTYKKWNAFVRSKDHPDNYPNQLTPSERKLHLVDSGFACNNGIPLVVRPVRNVDVILSYNYTWGSQFKALKLAEKHCVECQIPFPKIDVSEINEANLKECYMFMDKDDPRVPIVLHFPLVNDTFRHFKAPGIQRCSAEENAEGKVDVRSRNSPYRTRNITYTPQDFDQLVSLQCYNVTNNRDSILEAFRLAVDRRRLRLASPR
nr:PREDICTED: cytosolic phospholipase A2 zeta-like isoform X2 [Latimeria chalumnae]XP_014340943.1 PREDICTED: cytosolic phospholipase A2 zeta-like isoform X2 [Latimeria chalumnae]|eukprot:XP_014340942.1 PREDICTED: cytosolic phospholipase A2 zeta-like isoform X2 [Latimeria chalumnae]